MPTVLKSCQYLIPCTLVASMFIPAGPVGAYEPAPPKVRRAFDGSTGRELLNYPPHRVADILHIKLDVVVPDMNTPTMQCVQTITFTPLANPLDVLTLDAANLNIRSASADGRTVAVGVRPGDDKLTLTFSPGILMGEKVDVRLDYEVHDPAEGVVWTPESSLWPGRAASFHTQGQPESNRYWYACHDFPNERLNSEVVVTVPAGFVVCSNGRQESHEQSTFSVGGGPAEKYHFVQSKEHSPYLISIAVGKFDIVDVSTFGSRLPMPVYCAVGDGVRAKKTFARTPKMISLYERLFNESYPWEKYAQVVVTNFAWGGMENTSATNLYDSVVLDDVALLDGDEDGLISHELAHQWFGNLLTCKSWEHLWLNEGWATYCEALWEQYRDSSLSGWGYSASPSDPTSSLRADNDAYQAAIWSDFEDVIRKDRGAAPYQPAMVSKEYDHPDDVSEREANPYPKGAAILHMLRRKLGDKAFFGGVGKYIDSYRNSPVETFQFRECLERASGLSLQQFFDQWCYRPGVPRLTIAPVWNPETKSIDVTVTQIQTMDGANPAFAFDLTVCVGARGKLSTSVRTIRTRVEEWSIPCEHEPSMVVFNQDLDVLAQIEVDQSADRFIEQLRSGSTHAARLQAAQHLARASSPLAVPALFSAARDARLSNTLRNECLKSLGRLANPTFDSLTENGSIAPASNESKGDPAALTTLLSGESGSFSESPVREEWARQLGLAAQNASDDLKKRAASKCLALWTNDRSYGVRAESLKSLGKLRTAAAIGALDLGLRTDSQHDQIRRGAIEGLAHLALGDSLDRVLPFAAPNHVPETRQAAIKAMVKLADQDKERVFNVISAIANQSDIRTRRAAIEALMDLGDPRGRIVVEQIMASTQSRSDRTWIRVLLRNIDEAVVSPPKSAVQPS